LAFLVQDGKTGFVIPGNDSVLLADRLTQLIKDSDLQQQMSQYSEVYAKQYAWEIISSKILQVYQEELKETRDDPVG
jgi:D-inositol-3-phosphate glycosyltransferase